MTICGFQETGGHPVKNKATRLNKGFYEVLYKNNCSVLFCHPFQAIFSADSLRKAAPIGWNHKLHSFREYQNFRINFTFIPYIYFFFKALIQRIDCFKKAFVTPSRAKSSEYNLDSLQDNLLSFFDKFNHPFYFIMFQFTWVFSERDIPLFLMFYTNFINPPLLFDPHPTNRHWKTCCW